MNARSSFYGQPAFGTEHPSLSWANKKVGQYKRNIQVLILLKGQDLKTLVLLDLKDQILREKGELSMKAPLTVKAVFHFF